MALGGLLLYLATGVLKADRFMAAGDRCTANMCGNYETRIRILESRELPPLWLRQSVDAIRLEQRRLQRQIDRLESEVFVGKRKPQLPPYSE